MRLPFGGRDSSDASTRTPEPSAPEEVPDIPWPSRRARAYGGPPPRRPVIVRSEPEYSEPRFEVPRGLVVGAICLIVTVVVIAGALVLRPSSGHAVDSHETTSTSIAPSSTTAAPTTTTARPVLATTTTVVATTAPPSTSPTTVKKKKSAKTKSPTTVPNPDGTPTSDEPTTPPQNDGTPTTTAPATAPLPESTPTTTGSTTTSAPPVPTTAAAAAAAGEITPGAFCSTIGAHGTYNGVSYVCSLDSAAGQPYADQRARWRQG